MSLTHPNTPVSQQDLKDFYDKIKPFLSAKTYAGFTPIGTIISIFGESAPANYLICDGATYNKSDYPELAAHLLSLTTHSQYEVSGDATKFKVPDLRGEFIRGTGVNGHPAEGNGENVGVHQSATSMLMCWDTGSNLQFRALKNATSDTMNVDKSQTATGTIQTITATTSRADSGSVTHFTSRPTNTSVLFCIATKNIYLDPQNSYSKNERVVGSYFNGKTVYQKTIEMTVSVNTNGTTKEVSLDVSDLNIETIARIDTVMANISALPQVLWTGSLAYITRVYHNATQNKLVLASNRLDDNGKLVRITIQYTKA